MRAPSRRLGVPDLGRAMASLAALVALAAGVPLGLVAVAGWPLPRSLPSLDAVADALAAPELPDAVLVKGAAVVVWVAWAALMGCVLVEIAAWLRGSATRRLPALAPLQALAARLVGSALLLLPSAGVLARPALATPAEAVAAATAPTPPPGAEPSKSPPAPRQVAPAPPAEARPSPAHKRYVVRPPEGRRRDTLWGIAERHLGDPKRWRDIFELNKGRPDPSGRVLVDPHWVYPGQELLMPPDAVGVEAAPDEQAVPPAVGQNHTVRSGDTLSSIAAERLGDASRAGEIFELNRGRAQPDGARLARPGLIRPGWTLELPDAPASPRPSPATGTAPPPAQPASPSPGAPPPARQPAQAQPGPIPDTPAPTTTGPPANEEAAPAARSDRPAGVRSDGRGPGAFAVAVAVGLPAAVSGAVLWRLDRLRRAQQRRRRRGHGVDRPDPDLEPVERVARAMPGTEAAEWVDLALRHAWSALAKAELDPVPAIACVRAGTLGVELLVDPASATAPAGFVADDGGHVWRLDPAVSLQKLRTLAEGQSPLLPALVSVGASPEGPVLVDLEHAGVLAVEGDANRVEAFLAGAALELASAPWADDTRVFLVGGDTRLAALDGVELTEEVGTLDGDLGALAAEREQALGPNSSVLAARVAPTSSEAWSPAVVVLSPGAVPGDEVVAVARHARPGRSGVALVAPGPVPSATWRLVIEPDGSAVLEPLGLALEVDVDAEAVAGMAELVGGAADGTDARIFEQVAPAEARPALTEVEDAEEPEPEVDGELEPVEIEVGVLGPVVVTWPDQQGRRQPPRRKLDEVVAYLATHDERPVPAERLRTALWPLRDDARAGEVADSTFRSTMSRVRAALGRDSAGHLHLPEQRNGAYALGPRCRSDWSRFKALARAARTASSAEAIDLLREALALVRGAPFADALPGTYAWAWSEQLISEIEVAVADAAEDLAERAREAGDAELARWGSRQGLLAIPSREALYRERMLAAFDAGDHDDIDQAYTEARRAARAVDDLAEPQDETSQLYERLKQACRSTANGPAGGSTRRARGA